MIDWLIRRRITAFERAFDYDMSHARDLLGLSRKAFWRFSRAQALAEYREGVPLEAWYAAKLAATLSEDCGPCTQLAVDMARRAGVSDATLRALLLSDVAALAPDASLGYRYAVAALSRDAALPALRDEVLSRWGPPALASLALVITAARMYPMLKYALGHGLSCQRVRVGEETVEPHVI